MGLVMVRSSSYLCHMLRTCRVHLATAATAPACTAVVCGFVAVQAEKARRDELHKEKDKLQGQVAELGGMVKSQQRLLELEKVCHDRSMPCEAECLAG